VPKFEHHLETRLWEIRRELDAGAYRWDAYRRFTINDPKRPEIRAAPFRDRVVHHALFNVLDPLFARGFIAYSASRTLLPANRGPAHSPRRLGVGR
jgi:RNA-directed DNA polymerase